MDKFKNVQNNILCSVLDSILSEKDKHDIYNYLFWNLAWDFDIDKFSNSIIDN